MMSLAYGNAVLLGVVKMEGQLQNAHLYEFVNWSQSLTSFCAFPMRERRNKECSSTESPQMTTANPQRQCDLFRKFCTEVRPQPFVRRDERIRSMACSFEEIAESEEEEDTQLPERTESSGRSPFAVLLSSPFARRRGTSSQSLSPTYGRKLSNPRLCRGFSDPVVRRRSSPTSMFSSLSPDRHESDLLTLPPILEGKTSSSSDHKEDSE